jgi:uncharacterized protein YukE
LPDFEEVPMAVTIAVAPVRLRRAAAAARSVGGHLLEVRGQLGATAAGLDLALGGPGARSAFATLWTRWSDSIEGLAGEVATLAGALEAAAEAYERTDRDSVPGDAGGARARGGVDAPAR